MLGDQSGVLVGRFRAARFDRRGQPPVHLGAIRFQLRFVGHRADQRMPEGVLGARGEPHLIDQLRPKQLVEHRIDPQHAQKLRAEARPITDAAFTVRLAPLFRRSMRASMTACTVAGTVTSAAFVWHK